MLPIYQPGDDEAGGRSSLSPSPSPSAFTASIPCAALLLAEHSCCPNLVEIVFTDLGASRFDLAPVENDKALAAFPRFDRFLRDGVPAPRGCQRQGARQRRRRRAPPQNLEPDVGARLGLGDRDEECDAESRLGRSGGGGMAVYTTRIYIHLRKSEYGF
ncbi:hypothetical protein PG993_001850 [Apiospora rasikravindrae]|uniref:Uncharacterized protein n=1 Tax=Apiospora rasikravindrae TaxID=990691 RepID=A0ABR1UCK8_9PEZI